MFSVICWSCDGAVSVGAGLPTISFLHVVSSCGFLWWPAFALKRDVCGEGYALTGGQKDKSYNVVRDYAGLANGSRFRLDSFLISMTSLAAGSWLSFPHVDCPFNSLIRQLVVATSLWVSSLHLSACLAMLAFAMVYRCCIWVELFNCFPPLVVCIVMEARMQEKGVQAGSM